MSFQVGDRVYIEIKEFRTDAQIVYRKSYGIVVEAFNAWSPGTGDRWQYKIRTPLNTFIVFHEGFDQGTIIPAPETKQCC